MNALIIDRKVIFNLYIHQFSRAFDRGLIEQFLMFLYFGMVLDLLTVE